MADSGLLNRNNTPHWYALYTRARFEKKVDLKLRAKGLESYLPLHTVIRQWSDRRKKVNEPLFSCYVFVRIPLIDRFHALQTHGVVRLVSFNGVPSPIPDEEIDAVNKILKNTDSFEITPHCFTIGQKVEVMHGPLAGIRGRLIEHRGQNKIVVSIEQIRQALSIEIDVRNLTKITEQTVKRKVA